jgi:hypothetical protein
MVAKFPRRGELAAMLAAFRAAVTAEFRGRRDRLPAISTHDRFDFLARGLGGCDPSAKLFELVKPVRQLCSIVV